MIDHAIPVHQLLPGQSAVVCGIAGDPQRAHRLEELGLLCGTRVEMFRPGNPCILRVAGGKFCLRCDGELQILVEPIGLS